MKSDHVDLWNRCLKIIKDNLSEETFKTWFSPIVPLKFENNELVIHVPSLYFYEYLEEQFVGLLHKSLIREGGKDIRLKYDVPVENESKTGMELEGSPCPSSIPQSNIKEAIHKFETPFETSRTLPNLNPQLNLKYCFANFQEGKSNKLACTAGKAIAENPGKTAFNPFFMFGPSGVGKTHLMNAIGIQAKEKNPAMRVLYVPAQLFKVQYTDSVRNNRTNDFLNFYQTIDLLIVDDIQEFESARATQNTFFHIFNHLQQSGKQIILSADKPPVNIQGLEERLLSRFKWGLIAEIERPDYELNKAILHQKIKKDGLNFPEDVIEYIASNVKDNIRDLEGIIVSLMAHSTFQNKEITLELAKKEMAKCILMSEKEITIEDIQEIVCNKLNIDQKLIFSPSRKREIVQVRQISMYLSKKYTSNSLSHIGEAMGKKDHATVLHACKTVKNQMEYDKAFSALVNEIEMALKAV